MKKLTFVMLAILLTGCFNDLIHEERITGNYYLYAIETKSDMKICYKGENSKLYNPITNPGVRAVWNNDRYIIARNYQCVYDSSECWELNQDSTEFYIIDMESRDKESYLGPFSEQKYLEKKKKLNITEEIVFRELFPQKRNPKR